MVVGRDRRFCNRIGTVTVESGAVTTLARARLCFFMNLPDGDKQPIAEGIEFLASSFPGTMTREYAAIVTLCVRVTLYT